MRIAIVLMVLCTCALMLPTASSGQEVDALEAAAAVEAPPVPVPPVAEVSDVPEAAPDTATPAVPEIVTTTTTAPAETTTTTTTAEPPSTWALLGWQLAGYVVPVLGALLTALIGFGIQWVRAKTKDLRWQSVLDQLDDAVDTAVAAVQQTIVDGLKAAAVDGKLTADERLDVFERALAAVKRTMGVEGLAALQAAMQAGQQQLEDFLKAKIEASVGAQKPVST